jgi:hypothetical protein
MNICFEQVTQKHLDVIYAWLAQDFVVEFWDNTQAHKDDIVNFVGKKYQMSINTMIPLMRLC